MTTVACTVDATGISAPTFATIQDYFTSTWQAIFGSDAYLQPDSQEGQFIAVVTAAVNDSNAVGIAIYNGFSPLTAQGAQLSSSVKLNGIRRQVATSSTVPLVIVGQANTVITNGQARDTAGNYWALPASVTIPTSGTTTVIATAVLAGSISAAIGSVSTIATPTLGWQTVTNLIAATPGQAVETDAQLRRRQALSTALPAVSPVDAIQAGVANVTGVTAQVVYENPTQATDANGLPPHSIAVVAQGGADADIATAILNKKTPGTTTYGTSSATVFDSRGQANTENFFRPTIVQVNVTVTIQQLAGYSSATAGAIQSTVASYINGLNIGDDVFISRIYPPAQLTVPGAVNPLASTFHVTGLTIGVAGGSQGTMDIVTTFNQLAVAGTVTVVGG